MKKFLIFLLLLAAIGAGGYYWWLQRQNDEDKGPQISTIKVARGSISLVVSTTGRVVANFDVEIKCKASGQITKLPYDISDKVSKDALLVELDPVDEQRGVEQARVALQSSQARLIQAKQNLVIATKKLATEKQRAETALTAAQAQYNETQSKANRLKRLIGSKLASQEQYDSVIAEAIQAKARQEEASIRIKEVEIEKQTLEIKRQDIELAQSQVDSNRIALSIAEQRLTDTKVFAPIDGIVTTRNVQIGQIISSGISNVGGGTTMLTLSDLSRIFVHASVDESDIGKVKVGQPALITTDAFPQRKFRGEVVRIASRGVNSTNVVTFEVKIEVLDRKKSLLKPEMTANIEIIAAQKDSALLVPSEAVYRKSRASGADTPQTLQVANGSPSRPEGERRQPPGAKDKRLRRNQGQGAGTTDKQQHRRSDRSKHQERDRSDDSGGRQQHRQGAKFSFRHKKKASYFVQIFNGTEEPEERQVRVGINDGVQVEIIHGVKEGELIVLGSGEAESRWRRQRNPLRRAGRMMFRGRRR